MKNLFAAFLSSILIFVAVLALAGEEVAFIANADSDTLVWDSCGEAFAEGCGIAVLNIDEDGRNADVFFRYPAGQSFPEHWHTSAERILVIRGQMEVTYEGQEAATVVTGEYAFGPAGRKHHGTCVGDTDCLAFIAFEDPPDTHLVTD